MNGITWLMSRKRVIVCLFMLVFMVSLYSSANLGTSPASPDIVQEPLSIKDPPRTLSDGENWLTGWQYRERIDFYEVAGAGTDYPFSITVTHDTDDGADNWTAGYQRICTEGNAQTDFDDVRFTDNDGSTVLDYWRESYTVSTTSEFWFKLNDDVSSGTVRAYIYYGNSAVSTGGDPQDVFLFYDDFGSNREEYTWTNYTTGSGSASAEVTDGNLHFDLATSAASSQYGYRLSSSKSWSITNYKVYATGTWTGLDDYRGYCDFFGVWVNDTHGSKSGWVYQLINDLRFYTRAYADNAQVDANNPADAGDEAGTYTVTYIFEGDDYDLTVAGEYGEQVTGTDSGWDAPFHLYYWSTIGATTVPPTAIDTYLDTMYALKYMASGPYITYLNAEETATPSITSPNVLTNPDDTNNLYARYKKYVFTVNASMSSGYTDIDYIGLSLYTASPEWNLKYVEDTDTFSENPSTSSIELVTGDCEFVKSGTDIDLVFVLWIEWVHDNESFTNLNSVAWDEWGGYGTESTALALDVETRLDFTPSLSDGSGTVDRGDYDTLDGITASGTVIYYGGTVNPPSDEVDVWVSSADVAGSPWSDLTLSSGVFSMTVDSDDVVGLDTYTFKAVQESAGSGGTDECHETHTDTYIADREQVTWIAANDTVVNPSDVVLFTVGLIYDYDDTAVTTGSFSLQYGSTYLTLTHDASGNWTTTDTSATAVGRTYNAVNGSDTTHGITSVDANSKSVTVTWDKINLTISTNYDWSIVGYNVTLSVTGLFDYSGWTWNGTATWNCSTTYPVETTVGKYYYTVSSITEPDYGVTSFQVTPLYVVFDNITGTFVLSPSEEISNTYVYTIFVSGLSYSYNSSTISSDWLFEHIKNDTSYISGYGTDGSGYWNPVTVLVPVNSSWSAWKYECNASLVSRGFDFTFYTATTSTDKANDWAYVTPYTSSVDIFEDLSLSRFQLYVDGTRIYDRDWKFYGSTSASYEICIKDYFGNELYNSTHAWARNIDVLLQFYVLKIYSQIQEDPLLFTISRGGSTSSEPIGPNEILKYHVASGTYTYTFSYHDQIKTGTIEILSSDEWYTVTDIDLWDLFNKPDNAGGDDDEVELAILNMLTYGILGLFGFMFIIQIPAVQRMLPGGKQKVPANFQGYEHQPGEREPWGGERRRRY
jgi:hypothetical protein